jgi:hypothetical protein
LTQINAAWARSPQNSRRYQPKQSEALMEIHLAYVVMVICAMSAFGVTLFTVSRIAK